MDENNAGLIDLEPIFGEEEKVEKEKRKNGKRKRKK